MRRRIEILSIILTIATVYHTSLEGRKMANHQIYHHNKISCAHNGFPLGTWLIVISEEGYSVHVQVTDRIKPKYARRNGEWVVDLSGAAWKKITKSKPTVIKVTVKRRPDERKRDVPCGLKKSSR